MCSKLCKIIDDLRQKDRMYTMYRLRVDLIIEIRESSNSFSYNIKYFLYFIVILNGFDILNDKLRNKNCYLREQTVEKKIVN